MSLTIKLKLKDLESKVSYLLTQGSVKSGLSTLMASEEGQLYVRLSSGTKGNCGSLQKIN